MKIAFIEAGEHIMNMYIWHITFFTFFYFFIFYGNGGLIYKITSSYITNSGPLGTYSVRPKACHIPYKTYIDKTGTGTINSQNMVLVRSPFR